MILPVVFIKVLETSHPRGDRATSKSPAWKVTVCNGDKEFYPVSGFSCFADGYYFDKADAVKWAWQVSNILGGVPLSLYRAVPNAEPIFVEDFE